MTKAQTRSLWHAPAWQSVHCALQIRYCIEMGTIRHMLHCLANAPCHCRSSERWASTSKAAVFNYRYAWQTGIDCELCLWQNSAEQQQLCTTGQPDEAASSLWVKGLVMFILACCLGCAASTFCSLAWSIQSVIIIPTLHMYAGMLYSPVASTCSHQVMIEAINLASVTETRVQQSGRHVTCSCSFASLLSTIIMVLLSDLACKKLSICLP